MSFNTSILRRSHFGLHMKRGMGAHVIVDLHGASNLDCEHSIRDAIDEIIEQTGATLLHQYFHRFTPLGITGVACLRESHISVHTWPEQGFAAFDIYMCGEAQPERAIPILQAHFNPRRIEVRTLQRGGSLNDFS